MQNKINRFLMATVLLISTGVAQASIINYVGSWQVGDGPSWSSNPLAYSGTGAAELLFGEGTYYISTVDDQLANINNMAHYAIIGVGFDIFADDYFRGTEGVTHYKDVYVYDANIDTVSAYVKDFGAGGTNYAFRVTDVPEPALIALLGLAIAGLGFSRKKR